MISEKDIKIVSYLRKNSRATLTDISKKTNVPVSTVYDRIKSTNKNIIKKYTSIVDFPKLGYNIRAQILLKAKETQKFHNLIKQNYNINSVYRLNSEYNYLFDVIFKTMSGMEKFNRSLDSLDVEKVQIHFVSEQVFSENFNILEDDELYQENLSYENGDDKNGL